MKIAKNKIYCGWDEDGVFECHFGENIRLNDLAMFSIYLARMAVPGGEFVEHEEGDVK